MLFLLKAVSNIISECVTIMHAKASLCQNDLCSSKSIQIPSECTIQRLLFFSAVQNRFKYRQNVLVFNLFTAVQNSFEYRQNASFTVLFSKFSLHFQIVSNIVRMHYFLSLFSNFSLQFQIVRIRALFLVLDLSLKFQINISNSFRMFHLTVHVYKSIRWGRPTTSRPHPPLTQILRTTPGYSPFLFDILQTTDIAFIIGISLNKRSI